MLLRSIFQPYAIRGFVVGLGIVALCYFGLLAWVLVNYDGRCGMGFPLGERPECTFPSYVWDSATLLLAVATEAWWVLLIVVMLSALVGYLIGNWRTNS